jgi:DNA-binding transcriptional LysR family regulator
MMNSFSYKQLRYIAAIASEGSIIGASQKINISASSIREALHKAEDKVGAPLFLRSIAKGMRPTEEGVRFLSYAEPLFEAHETFQKNASGVAQNENREITIGVLANASAGSIPQLISELEKQKVAKSYRIIEMDSESLVTAVRTGKLLVGLGFNDFLHPSLTFVSLRRAQLHVGLPLDHRLAGAKHLTLHDVANEPYIFLNFPGAHAYYSGLFNHYGIKPKTRFTVDTSVMAQKLIENGFGYATFNMTPTRTQMMPDTIARVPLKTDYWNPTFGMFFETVSAPLRQVKEIKAAALAAWSEPN